MLNQTKLLRPPVEDLWFRDHGSRACLEEEAHFSLHHYLTAVFNLRFEESDNRLYVQRFVCTRIACVDVNLDEVTAMTLRFKLSSMPGSWNC